MDIITLVIYNIVEIVAYFNSMNTFMLRTKLLIPFEKNYKEFSRQHKEPKG